MSSLAILGHNNPPSPYEVVKLKIDDLHEEALHWLDGAEVDSEELAEGVATLLDRMRKAAKEADTERKKEKEPFLEGGRAVDKKYKELSDKAKRVADACKASLKPWLKKLAEVKRQQEAEAKRIADEAAAKASEALANVEEDNLASKEALAEAEEFKRKADIGAASAANARVGAKPAFGKKAVSLRTYHVPEITDPITAVEHYWTTKQERVTEFFLLLAKEDVRAGAREIPGFVIKEDRRPV